MTRALNLLLCAAIAAVLTAPLFWLNCDLLWSYYVVGHVTGAEPAIRAAMSGTTTWWGALAYYPISILRDHLGVPFLVAAGLLILTMPADEPWGRFFRQMASRELGFLLLAILVPLVVLTLDGTKVAQVGGIVGVPVLLLVLVLICQRAPSA